MNLSPAPVKRRIDRLEQNDVEHLQRGNRLRRTGTVTGTKTLIVMGRWARPE